MLNSLSWNTATFWTRQSFEHMQMKTGISHSQNHSICPLYLFNNWLLGNINHVDINHFNMTRSTLYLSSSDNIWRSNVLESDSYNNCMYPNFDWNTILNCSSLPSRKLKQGKLLDFTKTKTGCEINQLRFGIWTSTYTKKNLWRNEITGQILIKNDYDLSLSC